MAGIREWLWLAEKERLNSRLRLELLKHFATPERIYYADAEEYSRVCPLSREQTEELMNKDVEKAERILDECSRLGIRIITLGDAAYPSRLRAIDDPPCLLYVKGTWPDFDNEAAVSIIGTRHATPYGLRVSERLGFELSRGGAYIVSGMALGGDAASQRGALKAGKPTAAVLGCGVDVVYPAANRQLYDSIIERGVLVSEYPPGTRPIGKHFPRRNRIISGLSVALVVVEAGRRSGTNITVDFAIEQGRDVYAVPGPIDAPYSEGTNRMLRDGAFVLTGSRDLLQDLAELFPARIDAAAAMPPQHRGSAQRPGDETRQRPPVSERPAAPPKTAELPAVPLTEPPEEPSKPLVKLPPVHIVQKREESEESPDCRAALDAQDEAVLQVLSQSPMYVDDIADAAGMAVRRVLSALTTLEIAGLVCQESGNRYRTVGEGDAP